MENIAIFGIVLVLVANIILVLGRNKSVDYSTEMKPLSGLWIVRVKKYTRPIFYWLSVIMFFSGTSLFIVAVLHSIVTKGK
jgi:uncharacterized membrane protein